MPRNLEEQIYTEVHQLRSRQKTQRGKKAALILSIAIVIGLIYWIRDHSPIPSSTESTTSTPKSSFPQSPVSSLTIPTPEPSFPPVEMPSSGTVTAAQGNTFGQLRLFLSFPTEADKSKLPDRCPANTLRKNDLNYFLKVVDWESKQTVLTAFIRAGEKVTLNLPAGTYKLRYAAGEKWYGEEHLFGTKTRYGEVTELMDKKQPLQFKFERQGDIWDLGLYGCNFGGNTSTKTLKPEDF